MSILGKILVFLNVLAALAFFYLATVDFAKRQHWAYALYRHDLRIKGLPLTDREGHVLARNLDPKTLQELFAGSAPQVKSQTDEVKRVRQQVQGDIESTTAITVSNPYDPKEKLELKTKLQKLAWALRPLSDLPARRQADDVKAHEAMASRHEMLTRLMILRDDQPLVLDGLFTSDVEQELMKQEPSKRRQLVAERLEKDLNQAFDEPNEMVLDLQKNKIPKDREEKRRAVAHLLLGLAELSVDKTTPPGKDRNLIADSEYRRALAVVGLEAAVREMDSQAKDLAAMAEGVSKGMGRDRNLFAVQHAALVPRLLEMADDYHNVRAELERKKNEVVTQDELVKVRRQEIEKLESKLGERQKATRALLDEQTRLEKTLFKAQQDFRDAADENHKLEREVGTLEKGR